MGCFLIHMHHGGDDSFSGCRTRKDSVRVVEVLFTATPEFFKGKKLPEIRQYFEETLRFFGLRVFF